MLVNAKIPRKQKIDQALEIDENHYVYINISHLFGELYWEINHTIISIDGEKCLLKFNIHL